MKKLSLLIALLSLSSCATIMGGGRQSVTVLTPGVEGAKCTLEDTKGRVSYVEQTPSSTIVKRGDGPITVICEKEGYLKGTGTLKESIAPANYGNLALLALAPIGYFIDGLTGSAQIYKNSIEIEMEPKQ